MPQYQGTGFIVSPHDAAFAAYLDAACWSSHVDGEDELYAHHLTDEAVQKMREDWEDFRKLNAELIKDDLVQAAQDFWLTRNRHGAGFWDGHWPQDVADRLTKAAHVYGEVHLWADDDGRIHHY
jgi:hypothetical protein